jgi:hypothetical protein
MSSEWDAYPDAPQTQGQDPWAAFPDAPASQVVQTPAPAKQERGWGAAIHDYITGAADQAQQGASFGFLDEANAGMRAGIRGVGNIVTGQAPEFGANYDRALADERGRMHQFQEENPITSGVSNLVGGLATGGAGAGIKSAGGVGYINALRGAANPGVESAGRALIPELVAGAKSLPGVVARSAGVGAGAGAVGGFGGAEGGFEKRLAGAGVGALFGGAVGAASPAVAGAVKGAWNAGKGMLGRVDADEAAADFAVRALSRDKFDLSGNGTLPANEGKPMAIADMAGGNTRRLGRTVQTTPGEGSDHAERFLHERQYGQADRIKDDIDTHISGQDRIDSVKARGDQRRDESAPLYDQANQQNIHSDRLQQFLDDPIAQDGLRAGMERARIRAVSENEPFNPDDYISNGGPINTRAVDAVKNGIDDMLETYRDKTTGKLILDGRGREIESFRKALLTEADILNPTYGQARAAYAEPSRLIDATERGRDVLKGNTQETVRNFGAMDPDTQNAYRIGAADTLKESVGNTRDGTHAVPKLYGGDNARARVNMLADDKDAFGRKMDLEDSMNRTRNTVTGGSVTGRIEADKEDSGAIAAALRSAAGGNGVTASALTGIGKLLSRAGGMNEATAEKLSKILFSSDQGQNANALANLVARAQQNQAGVRRAAGATGGGVQSIGNLLGQFMAPEERR